MPTAGRRVLYSVLDLAPIVQGGNAARSLRESLDLARAAERWGYHRFWLAEHHNIPGVASSATAVVIGHVAGGTRTIRVGAGGIMLPNHAPLVIAEQFGTLASLHPGRIDLGVGRAPGGDAKTARALRRYFEAADTFPADLRELMDYFRPATANRDPSRMRAVPGEGLDVPVYVLGSSDFGARLAAELGLPFAFASHFAPDYLNVALDLYRGHFKPSPQLDRPHTIVGLNVVAADTDAEAARLFTTVQQQFLGMIRGTRAPVPPPVDTMAGRWTPAEQAQVLRMTRYSAVGSPRTVREQIGTELDETGADEVIVAAQLFDHAARLRSFELAAQVLADVGSSGKPVRGPVGR